MLEFMNFAGELIRAFVIICASAYFVIGVNWLVRKRRVQRFMSEFNRGEGDNG